MIASLVRTGSIGTIVLDDGGVNRLSRSAIADFDATVSGLPSDLSVVCVRSARGGLFAAGADMSEMVRFGSAEADAFSTAGQSLMNRITEIPCATVALIDGECHGGALDLVMAFDLRIATTRSRFAHPGARLGIVTGFAGTVRIPDRTTDSAARAMFLTGAPMTAADAHERGIVDLVVDDLDSAEAVALVSKAADRRDVLVSARPLIAAGRSLDLQQLALLATRTHQLLNLREKN